MKSSDLWGLVPLLGLCATTAVLKADDAPAFALGVDMSLVKYTQDHGVSYKDNGETKDPLVILKDHGCNYVRLRLMVDPNGQQGQVNTLPYTLAIAQQVKQAGLHLLLDFFYSDEWADPGHQNMPGAWRGLSHADLVDKVFNYTKDTLSQFHDAGCQPDMIEVGNEITNGMMWGDGGPISDEKWSNLVDLIEAGARAARAADPSGAIKIVIHIDKGDNQGVSRWFFDNIQKRNVPYDIIGLSYYPYLSGPLSGLQNNLKFLAATYHKDVIVVETSFAWQGTEAKKLEFPSTPDGQKAYLNALLQTVASTPDGHGKGVFYWAADWIQGNKWSAPGGGWESRAFFDDSGNIVPAVDAYRDFAQKQSAP